jgi:hypothetical protein
MHYFSCSVWTGRDSTKSPLGHITPNLCVSHLVGSIAHIVHLGVSRSQNVDALFFSLECPRTRYTKLVFL